MWLVKRFLMKCIVFVLWLIALALCAEAQPPNVSILTEKHPHSALLALKKNHAKAVEKKDAVTEGLCLQKMGQICYIQGHYAQALDFYLHADKVFNSISDKNLNANNLADMGLLYYYNKQSAKARQTYNKALSLYRNTGNAKGEADILGKIGHLYEKRHLYDSAFYYQKLALGKYNIINNRQGVAKIYENFGSIYEDLANYDSAYACFTAILPH